MSTVNLSPQQLFLIDSIGALTTALLLGVVLVRLESVFGMPRNVLYILASVASAFAIYSFLCYRTIKENRRPYLRIIALANLLYCVLTLVLVIYFWQELTKLGVAYFFIEAMTVISLATIELKAVFPLNSSRV